MINLFDLKIDTQLFDKFIFHNGPPECMNVKLFNDLINYKEHIDYDDGKIHIWYVCNDDGLPDFIYNNDEEKIRKVFPKNIIEDVNKGRLKLFSSKLISKLPKAKKTKIKVFVDTAPLMEKPLAEKSGLGWQGKHTNLVSRDFGSLLFLGIILVNHSFEYDSQEKNYCGSCTKCLDICPTDAFYEENKLNASKCISYLTIEHRNAIPKKFRTAIGNRIFGCDDCLAICPWNKYAKITKEIHFNENKYNFNLNELLNLSDQEFRKKFTGSPIKRIGRDRFIRNCCIAAGNSKNKELIPTLVNLIIKDQSFLVRGAAIWALQQLDNKNNLKNIKKRHLSFEKNKDVLAEWHV